MVCIKRLQNQIIILLNVVCFPLGIFHVIPKSFWHVPNLELGACKRLFSISTDTNYPDQVGSWYVTRLGWGKGSFFPMRFSAKSQVPAIWICRCGYSKRQLGTCVVWEIVV